MKSRGIKITLPSINSADFGFKPDSKNNQIVFGIKGINGIGDDVVYKIIENRPYKSFDDFFDRLVVKEQSIKTSHLIQLIKAGCFDELEDRLELMKRFIFMISQPKSRVTLQNFQGLITNSLVPEQFNLQVRVFRFRKYIMKNIHKIIENTNPKLKKKYDDRYFILDSISCDFFGENFSSDSIVKQQDGKLIISEKLFDKEYQEYMQPVRDWIKEEQKAILKNLNNSLFEEMWNKHAKGTLSTWEMDSLCFYCNEHELDRKKLESHGVVNHFDLKPDGEIAGHFNWNGQKIPKFEINRICGTILDKNKYKHTLTLLTPDGIVNVKFYGGAFSHYDKQISRQLENGRKQVVERSWFKRGNLVMIAGYRSEKYFRPKTYVDSIYQHTVTLIESVDENGNIQTKSERTEV